jgi:hypothetical protein
LQPANLTLHNEESAAAASKHSNMLQARTPAMTLHFDCLSTCALQASSELAMADPRRCIKFAPFYEVIFSLFTLSFCFSFLF